LHYLSADAIHPTCPDKRLFSLSVSNAKGSVGGIVAVRKRQPHERRG